MPENHPKGNVRHILLPIITFAIGITGGLLLKQPSPHEESIISVSSSELDDVTCDQDLPVVAPVLWRENYTLAYDGRSRNPFWVQEVLTMESVKSTEQEKNAFKEDPGLPPSIRSHPEDYSKTGFAHGNMLSVSNVKENPIAKEEGSLMSHTCPQCPHLLKGYWANLETSIKSHAKSCDETKIITGPLYLPKQDENGTRYVKYRVIGDNDIAVPTHFFRLISSRQGENTEMTAYIIPNAPVPKDTPLDKFKTSVEEVERVSGIIFAK
jgi:endonuclease G